MKFLQKLQKLVMLLKKNEAFTQETEGEHNAWLWIALCCSPNPWYL